LQAVKLCDNFSQLTQGKVHCVFNHTLIADFSTDMLSPAYWQQQQAITGSAQGRGTTWFIAYQHNQHSEQHWVLKHYYRGGLIGKLINDSYWFNGLNKTRAACEFALLRHMNTLNLPAPQPIAYQVKQQGFYYTADLLTSRIENAEDLVALLAKKPLADDIWFAIGATIKRFHEQSIYHHDLNSHNILLNDKAEVFLIDFDRGELRTNPIKTEWKQDNIKRLERSFLKEKNKLTTFHFNDDDWQNLLQGYHNSATRED
jgi:3-deoxy-D-manno-octulosonic acid kinase